MAFTIENNMPSAGNIRWTSLNMQYKGINYAITNGYTNYIYVYWAVASPTTLVVSNVFPTLGIDDCLIFLNKSGIAVVVPASTVISGDIITPGTILASNLAANTITGDRIAAGTIAGTNLIAGTISATQIAANAIGASAISANVITGDKLVVDAITAREIAAATITANEIAANTIVAGNIAAGTITAAKMVAGTITAASAIIADAAITSAKIADATIVNGDIANATILGAKIANATITDANIASLSATKITTGTLTIGTPAHERLEIIPNGGALLHGYNAANAQTVDYGAKGINWYDDTGAIFVTDSMTTGNETVEIYPADDVQAIIYALPKTINHDVVLNFNDGAYNVGLIISGFTGTGRLWITGVNLGGASIYSFFIRNNTVSITCQFFTISTTVGNGIYIDNCDYVEIGSMDITVTVGGGDGIQSLLSNTFIHNCVISNKRTGIYYGKISSGSMSDISGSGNAVGLKIERSIISDGGSITITGTTPKQLSYGSAIIPPGGINPTSNAFTPTIYGSSTAGTPTYTRRDGSYYRIGNSVHCDIWIHLSVWGGMAGSLKIKDLPFAAKNIDGKYACVAFGQFIGVIYPTGYSVLQGQITPNTSEIVFIFSGSNVLPVPLTQAYATSSLDLMLSVTYEV